MVWESGVKRHKKTIAAIEAAMGKPPPEAKAAVMVVQRGQRRPLRAAARITLEDGAELCAHDALPGDLAAGYHTLRSLEEDRATKLIVSPGVCHLPEPLRVWGVPSARAGHCTTPAAAFRCACLASKITNCFDFMKRGGRPTARTGHAGQNRSGRRHPRKQLIARRP